MSSPLKDRITEDMKAAMRAKDDRLLAIRGLLAACKQREIDERIVLDDVAVVAIVDKQIKRRRATSKGSFSLTRIVVMSVGVRKWKVHRLSRSDMLVSQQSPAL